VSKETIKSKSFRAYANPETKVLKIYSRDAMTEFLNSLNGEVEIHITEVDNRTHWQNRYYWKVVIGTMLLDEQFGGYTKNELHEALKAKFKIVSTKLLTVAEFTEYLDCIIRWCHTDIGIRIPDPDE